MGNQLIWFVILYLAVTIGIGLYAATRVHNTRDYAVAGRSLPMYVVIATVFATWFGSETVLGLSSRFVTSGLRDIVEDPFGSSMCLILVGVFFAAKLYRMNLLTIGDYYRKRYNRTVEVLASLAILFSYLGWVSAQLVALGLVFKLVSGGAVSLQTGIMIGAAIVTLYTLYGGMFSVAWTDTFQMTIIIFGLLYIAWQAAGLAGGVGSVVEHASQANKFEFWPPLELKEVLAFVGAGVTLMFGSIPQQDVFQRVTAAKTERIAVWGTILGGSFYFLFAAVPIFLAYSAIIIDPTVTQELLKNKDSAQQILPSLVMNHMPLMAQILFFGALLSAIMSTASGTLLAPSLTFTENILKPFLNPGMSDKALLRTMRIVVFCFGVAVTIFALNSKSSIYEMVGNAYKVTLVAAFIPLVMGLYWKRATTQGALFSITCGMTVWLLLEAFHADGLWPPQLAGLLASFLGMLIGSLLPQVIAKALPTEPNHTTLHHHAATQTHHVSEPPHHPH